MTIEFRSLDRDEAYRRADEQIAAADCHRADRDEWLRAQRELDPIDPEEQPIYDIPEGEPDDSYGEWLEQSGGRAPLGRPTRESTPAEPETEDREIGA